MSLDTIVAMCHKTFHMHDIHCLLNAVEVSTSISNKMYLETIMTITLCLNTIMLPTINKVSHVHAHVPWRARVDVYHVS